VAEDQKNSLIRSPLLWTLMATSFAVSCLIGYLVDIRFDEAYTLDTTSRSVGYAFTQAIRFEQQAPLYFVLLSIWRRLDQSIFFARLFSVLLAPLTVWAAAAAARRLLPGVAPLLAAAVAGIHYQIVWGAVEIRPYALMMLLSCIILITFYDGFIEGQGRRRSQILFVIVCVASLYTQYYLGFLMAGCGISLLIANRRAIPSFAVCTAVITALFVPMAYAVTSQLSAVAGQTESVFGGIPLVKAVYQLAVSLMLPVEWISIEPLRAWLVRFAIVGIGAVFGYGLLRRREKQDVVLAVITATTVFLFLAANYFLGEQGIQKRHFSVVWFPLMILPFAAYRHFNSRVTLIVLAAVLVSMHGIQLFATYRSMAKPGDPRRVAEYIMANEAAGEPILIFHADKILSVRLYYNGPNPLIALPQENSFDEWDPRRNVLRDEQQLVDIIDLLPGGPTRFWLVKDGWCAQGSLDFNCGALERFVDTNFRVIEERQFLEPATVRLIERKR
jgi:uncharacterized membrane protein